MKWGATFEMGGARREITVRSAGKTADVCRGGRKGRPAEEAELRRPASTRRGAAAAVPRAAGRAGGRGSGGGGDAGGGEAGRVWQGPAEVYDTEIQTGGSCKPRTAPLAAVPPAVSPCSARAVFGTAWD